MAKRRNIYTHEIDFKKIQIKNAPAFVFANKLEKLNLCHVVWAKSEGVFYGRFF